MKKRTSGLLSILLALCLALALLPGTALAEETSGTCGDNVTWTYNDGVLTIQGTGDMKDYSDVGGYEPPWFWTTYRHQIHTVNISDGVTSIGEYAFFDCSNLTSVTIPDSVTSIGEYAFGNCASLTSVTIPDGMTTIEAAVFWGCRNLTSVTIPDSVTTIVERAFAVGPNLTDVYYGGSESQWKQITIENATFNDWNGPLLRATVHYNSAGPAPSTSGSIPVTVNGAAVVWTDAEPFIDENDRTMVPLRAVADAMGLTVSWDENAREAVFTNGSKTIYFPIGSTTARTSEGGTVQMDTAAVIVNERTYAPIRYLAEYFGYTVGWDDAARSVSIT